MASTITVDFNAQTASVDKQIDKLNRDLTGFSRQVEKTSSTAARSFRGLGAAIAGVVSVGALTAATKSSLDFADSLGKAAERTGFSVQALQELRFAGDQTGVSLGEVDSALARFSKRLGLFRTTGGGAAAKVFEDLQINVNQLDEAVFRDVVDVISQVDSQVNRLALTTQFFGDDAQRLELTLRGGTDQLDAFARQAEDLGLVLDEGLVRGAESANDQLSILGQVIQIELTRSLVELAPEIERVARAFIESLPAIVGFLGTISDGISTVGDFTRSLAELAAGAEGFEGLSSDFLAADEFDSQINDLLSDIDRLGGALDIARSKQQQALTVGNTDQADFLGTVISDTESRIQSLQEELDRVNEIRRSTAQGRLDQRLGGDSGDDQVVEASRIDKLLTDLREERAAKAEKSNKRISDSEKEIQRIIQETRTPLEIYIQNVEQLETFRSRLGEDTFARALAQEAETFQAASEEGQKYAEIQREINQIIRDTQTPVEEYIESVERLEELRPLLGEELFGRALEQEALDLVEATKEIGVAADNSSKVFDDLGSAIASSFEDAIVSGGDLGDILKGLEEDIIRIVLRSTITQPLGDFIGGALSGASGGGGIIGNFLGGLFGGARQSGGPVNPGQAFLVGERGPELFVPQSRGNIVPNGMGGSIVNNINISTPSGTLSQDSLSQLQVRLGESINRSLARNT